MSESLLVISNGPAQALLSLSDTFFFLRGVKIRTFAPFLNSSGGMFEYALDRCSVSYFHLSLTISNILAIRSINSEAYLTVLVGKKDSASSSACSLLG